MCGLKPFPLKWSLNNFLHTLIMLEIAYLLYFTLGSTILSVNVETGKLFPFTYSFPILKVLLDKL